MGTSRELTIPGECATQFDSIPEEKLQTHLNGRSADFFPCLVWRIVPTHHHYNIVRRIGLTSGKKKKKKNKAHHGDDDDRQRPIAIRLQFELDDPRSFTIPAGRR